MGEWFDHLARIAVSPQPRRRALRLLAGIMAGVLLVGPWPAWAGAEPAPPFVWPLSGSPTPDKINSPFGPRTRPITLYEFHEGIDLCVSCALDQPADRGIPVHAAADGTVRLLTDERGCRIEVANATNADPNCTRLYLNGGRIVQLQHGATLFTNYLHLRSPEDGKDCTPGCLGQAPGLRTDEVVHVSAGQVIGYVGRTGNASYYHLHFEVRDGGTSRLDTKNPLGYLPRAGNGAPAITELSLSSGVPCLPHDDPPSATDVSVAIEAPPHDVDLNQVILRIRDRDDMLVGERMVAFNERVNAGTNQPEMNGTCLQPQDFDSRSVYALSVIFREVPVLPQGSYEVVAIDVSGLTTRAILIVDASGPTTTSNFRPLFVW